MTTRTIPDPKKQAWRGIFPGEFAGEFVRGANIDLDKQPGRLLVSDRPRIITDSASGGITNIGTPMAFIPTGAFAGALLWMCLTKKYLFFASNLSTPTFGIDGTTNTPVSATNNQLYDAVQYIDGSGTCHLLVSGISDTSVSGQVWEYNSGSAVWTQGWRGLNTLSGSNPMGVLSNLLIIGENSNSTIVTVDNNLNVTNARLSLDRNFATLAIYCSSDRAWLMGSSSTSGGDAGKGGRLNQGVIYEWDGGNDTVNESYPLDSSPLSGFIVRNIPYFILRNGQIVGFTSTSFKPVAVFPIFEENLSFDADAIAIRGCSVDGDNVIINVKAPLGSKRMRSGAWVFNVKTLNLYPRYAFGQNKGSDQDFGQAIIATAGGLLYDRERDLLMAGAEIYTAYSGTTKNAIHKVVRNDSKGNRGYFVTPVIPTEDVEEYWKGFFLKFPSLRSNINMINAKYRVTDGLLNSSYAPIQLTITWVDTTHFTCVLPTGIANGNEVEILAGDNAGCLFHIQSMIGVPDGVTTITVTIDEAAPLSSTSTALAEFNDWVKINTNNPITSQTKRTEWMTFGAGGSPGSSTTASGGPYVQMKVELRGILTGIDQLKINSDDQEDSEL